MKTLFAVILLLFGSTLALAQPDPRDSVILESKTVYPGIRGATDTSAYLYVKAYITNKDSLVFLAISFLETSTSGGAYAVLGRPRSFSGMVNPLDYSFRYGSGWNTSKYHSDSPDSFLILAGFDPADPITIEPPNASRKAVWEIKFDSVWNFWGTFELDTVSHPNLPMGAANFTNTVPQDMPANFVKSVITVRPVPDVRDSVILESKTVVPGAGHPYTTVTVYITNKDSLTWLYLPLIERSTSGGAYGTLTRGGSTGGGSRSFSSVITSLVPGLRFGSAAIFSRYNSASPDTFLVSAGFDPADPTTLEPPNAVRKAVWQIKFDTIYNNLGTFELDSTSFFYNLGPAFTNTVPQEILVNFVKSVITVAYPKGDLNQDAALSPADVVWILNCVMLGMPPPGGVSSCDVNCDGMGTPADVVLELNAVFLGEPFPC